MNGFVGRERVALTTTALPILLALYILPLVVIVVGSTFVYTDLGSHRVFVALRNYVATARDATYHRALVASSVFTGLSVLVQVGFAFLAALLTRRATPLGRLLRWILVAPYFLPTIVVVIAWRFFSDPFVGPLSAVGGLVGWSMPDLRGPDAALAVMIITASYEAFPFTYLVLLARLLQVPKSLYEVAQLDGATPWKSFTGVTWPHIRGTLVALIALRVLITWLKFDVPWLVYARQAKSFWGDTLAVGVYRTGFEELRPGAAYALSIEALAIAGVAFIWWMALPGGGQGREIQRVAVQ